MLHNQNTFIDGMDAIAPDYQISKSGYKLIINGRQRLGYIEANNKPREVTTVPAGKKQGLIAVGEVLIAFIAGQAYYNIDGSGIWIRIAGFLMSTTVERFYSIAVSAATVNSVRKLAVATDNKLVNRSYDFNVAGNPACILVQDGVNQPWVIIQDTATGNFSARVTQTYSQWLNNGTNNEYVPIGTLMFTVDQKLYVVSPDKKRIYQSISGRPLDFMVNVDVNGNKLGTAAQGDANSTSFAFDSDEITCVKPLGIDSSSFLYGTSENLRIIVLDYNNTIFNEPTYYVAATLNIGVVNNNSIVDILGDLAVTDNENVKSFNAVLQLRNEADNTIFSLQLAKLLKNKKQTRCISTTFNDFAIFNLDTIYGNVFVIYDTILQKWIGLDITNVYAVKEFAVIKTDTEDKLYAITALDELFQLYSPDEDREVCQLHTRTFVASGNDGDNQVFFNQKSEYVKVYFQDGSEDANVFLTEFVDGQKSVNRLKKVLPENLAGLKFPLAFPIIFDTEVTSEPLTFTTKNGLKGHKLQYIVQWDSDARLQAIQITTSDEIPVVSKQQKERVYANS